jgi:heptosyltransferase-2
MKVAVLKPDHLGDLVLSAPALAALDRRFSDITLFCHPRSMPLARHLFPRMKPRPVLFPHLDKDRGADLYDLSQTRAALRVEADLLISLRWDSLVEDLVRSLDVDSRIYGRPADETHVALEHRWIVFPFTGWYDILSSYSYAGAEPLAERPREVGAVGLCISAGFHLNAWPASHWFELARCLDRRGVEVVLIGGPAEVARLQILAGAVEAELGYRPKVHVGSSDFAGSLRSLAEAVDLVIATDSGTAHLASLVRPVISLFGGSPWTRFAPLGRFNLILSRRYPCSPCWQFVRNAANLCHTQECLNHLRPEQVAACLDLYLAGTDFSPEKLLDGVWVTQAPWSDEHAVAA